jgi:hypothetical protein
MPAYPLLSYVAAFFERCTMPVYFALSVDFQKNALGTPVMDSRRLRTAANGGVERRFGCNSRT